MHVIISSARFYLLLKKNSPNVALYLRSEVLTPSFEIRVSKKGSVYCLCQKFMESFARHAKMRILVSQFQGKIYGGGGCLNPPPKCARTSETANDRSG